MKRPAKDQAGLLSDIKAYLSEHPDDAELEENFQTTFQPQIVQRAFGMTTRAFSTTIEKSLQ